MKSTVFIKSEKIWMRLGQTDCLQKIGLDWFRVGASFGIRVEINGVIRNVPISENNADYKFIKSRVDAGTLTIADAD